MGKEQGFLAMGFAKILKKRFMMSDFHYRDAETFARLMRRIHSWICVVLNTDTLKHSPFQSLTKKKPGFCLSSVVIIQFKFIIIIVNMYTFVIFILLQLVSSCGCVEFSHLTCCGFLSIDSFVLCFVILGFDDEFYASLRDGVVLCNLISSMVSVDLFVPKKKKNCCCFSCE
jgi:hypothetical protein